MEYKVVIADPETGKSYKQELKDDKAKRIVGKRLGEELDGSIVGLAGYKLKITGGSDKGGFPMKKGVQGRGVERVLMKGGIGYNSSSDVRVRKRVRGDVISENIIQVNMKVTEKGKKTLDEIFGATTEKKEEKKEE
jgi:small subunit ribosomal protein S6e